MITDFSRRHAAAAKSKEGHSRFWTSETRVTGPESRNCCAESVQYYSWSRSYTCVLSGSGPDRCLNRRSPGGSPPFYYKLSDYSLGYKCACVAEATVAKHREALGLDFTEVSGLPRRAIAAPEVPVEYLRPLEGNAADRSGMESSK